MGVRGRLSCIHGYTYSLSYSTVLVPKAGSNHVYLICVFIRYTVTAVAEGSEVLFNSPGAEICSYARKHFRSP